MTVCATCGREAEQPLLHALEYGHSYYPMSACPHGRRPIECEPCSELDFEQRIGWDDDVDGVAR